jgi:hypothetical protein
MKHTLRTFIYGSACALIAATLSAQAQDKKPDPTGTWTWSAPGRDGAPQQTTAKLKLDGDKLTGSVSGRQSDTAIENAKLSGDEISFTVTREFNNIKVVRKYTGKLSGDSIKGKISTEREGQTQSVDWNAKREAAKK